jgi:hypothetical protein
MHRMKEPRAWSLTRAGAPTGAGGEQPPAANFDRPLTLAASTRFDGRPIDDIPAKARQRGATASKDAATLALPADAMGADMCADRLRPWCGDGRSTPQAQQSRREGESAAAAGAMAHAPWPCHAGGANGWPERKAKPAPRSNAPDHRRPAPGGAMFRALVNCDTRPRGS